MHQSPEKAFQDWSIAIPLPFDLISTSAFKRGSGRIVGTSRRIPQAKGLPIIGFLRGGVQAHDRHGAMRGTAWSSPA
jgi:hypothetical protein